MSKLTVESLTERFAPLTDAEAQVVIDRVESDRARVKEHGGEPVELEVIVQGVKRERVGPAAHWEDVEPEPAIEFEDMDSLAELQAAIDRAVDEALQEQASVVEQLTTERDEAVARVAELEAAAAPAKPASDKDAEPDKGGAPKGGQS